MTILKLLINGAGLMLVIIFLSLWGVNDTHTSFDVLLVVGTVILSVSNVFGRLFSDSKLFSMLFQLAAITGFIMSILGAVNIDAQPVSQNLQVIFFTTISITMFNVLFPIKV